MITKGWGDNLMIALLAQCFNKAITVISTDSARTYMADGTEANGAVQGAIWIAHHSEFHYYGVLRAGDSLGRTGGFSGDCPLCTIQYECATCEHQRRLAQQVPASRVVDPGTSSPQAMQKQSSKSSLPELKRRRIRHKSQCPITEPPSCQPPTAQPPKAPQTVAKAAPSKKGEAKTAPDSGNRLCGNCGRRGHQAVTCTAPCFACGGAHKYFECDDEELHVVAKRQANRNRVLWRGWGSVKKVHKTKAGMKESGVGKQWVRKEYDPEYTPKRDISPKRAALQKTPHASDRCKTSLRQLWCQTEEESMSHLIDSGFLTDTCLSKDGSELPCKGILCISYRKREDKKGNVQHNRVLQCRGVPENQRHRFHWLQGSVFQGHTKLDASDVTGILQCFAASKSPEQASMDTGLNRDTCGLLLDRVRLASAQVTKHQRESLVFELCQVEADETVVRKEKVYKQLPDGGKERTGTVHHSVICLTQRGSTKQVMYMCEPNFVPVAESGKPSPPSLPSIDLVLPMMSKHFGDFVVLHTDGADAYRAACEHLKHEGYLVVQDHVVHSKAQWSAFGRHEVDDKWESCFFALPNDEGQRRIRVIKGSQKAEGLWRHLKHGSAGIPKEVHSQDERLDMYVQSLVWRMQCCGCPYRDTLRMCRAFRGLPLAEKRIVYQYGLTSTGEDSDGKKKAGLILRCLEVEFWFRRKPRAWGSPF